MVKEAVIRLEATGEKVTRKRVGEMTGISAKTVGKILLFVQ